MSRAGCVPEWLKQFYAHILFIPAGSRMPVNIPVEHGLYKIQCTTNHFAFYYHILEQVKGSMWSWQGKKKKWDNLTSMVKKTLHHGFIGMSPSSSIMHIYFSSMEWKMVLFVSRHSVLCLENSCYRYGSVMPNSWWMSMRSFGKINLSLWAD